MESSSLEKTYRFGTRVVHAGQEPDPSTGAIMTPIYQTSTYVQQAPGRHKGHEYGRVTNPTRSALEDNLAALEGADHPAIFEARGSRVVFAGFLRAYQEGTDAPESGGADLGDAGRRLTGGALGRGDHVVGLAVDGEADLGQPGGGAIDRAVGILGGRLGLRLDRGADLAHASGDVLDRLVG